MGITNAAYDMLEVNVFVVRHPRPIKHDGVRKSRTVTASYCAHYVTCPSLSLFLCRSPRKHGIVMVRSRTMTEVETHGTTFKVKTSVPEKVLLENTLSSDTSFFVARLRSPDSVVGPTLGSMMKELKWQMVMKRSATSNSRCRLLIP